MPQLTRTKTNMALVDQVCFIANYPCPEGDALLCDLGAQKHNDKRIHTLVSLEECKILIFWHQSIKSLFGDLLFTSGSFRYMFRAIFIIKILCIIWKTPFSISYAIFSIPLCGLWEYLSREESEKSGSQTQLCC